MTGTAPTVRASALAVLFAVAAALLGGCASPWERSFQAASSDAGRLPPPDRVVVREVPWARVADFLTELEQEMIDSDVHIEDWPAERRDEVEARLLRALQVQEGPGEVTVLGRSVFKTTDRVRPDDGSLERFARSIGADHVVWAERYVGRADRIVDRPVHTVGAFHHHDRRRRGAFGDPWSTTYVPVVIQADESAWIAYYLRRGR